MVTRRKILILGAGAPWLVACSGGGTTGSAGIDGAPEGRLAASSYGTKIVSWDRLDKFAGNSVIAVSDLPYFADQTTTALKLTASAPPSFGEGATLHALHYPPQVLPAGFSLGIWVKNPNQRTLNFELRLFNSSAEHTLRWNCAIEPTNSWTFLTLSPSQQIQAGWSDPMDQIRSVRITQQDHMAEGPWHSGEYLLFSNVYANVSGSPLFLITFDDGWDSQRNSNQTPIVSGSASVIRTDAGVLTTAATHPLVQGEPIVFTDLAPTGLVREEKYWVRSLPSPSSFTLATDASLTVRVATTGFSGVANYEYAGSPLRSGQQIVESYGFKGSLFLVPGWLGTNGVYGYGGGRNKFMSAEDARAMYDEGWSVGSHTNSHPSSGENAGLRLLGPYGYFLSNTVDNLAASYLAAWGLGPANRRRAILAAASTNVVTFENDHKFLVNMPIVFTDFAPPGLSIGTIYYCQSIPTPVTATFATDQGSLTATAVVTADWRGWANYQFAGASNDDRAIHADIEQGVAGVAALGIPTGSKFFALPQGSADQYVRSACIRANLTWVRGASSHAHTIAVGRPSGGGLSNIANQPGGWLAQPDCVQTDAARSPSITAIKTYIDETITQGACGCSYHHGVGSGNIANIDNMCAYLRAKADMKAISVVTLDQMASRLRF